MDLLGELGAFVDASSFLLSSALGRVQSFAVALAMLLDVLVLGHLCLLGGRGGGVVGALSGVAALSAVALQQAALTETQASAGTFAAGARVCDRCGDFLRAFYDVRDQACRVFWQGLDCVARD